MIQEYTTFFCNTPCTQGFAESEDLRYTGIDPGGIRRGTENGKDDAS